MRRWRLVSKNGRHPEGRSILDSTNSAKMRPDRRSGHAFVNDLARWAGRELILPSLRFFPSRHRAGVAGLMDEEPESHPQIPEGNRSANENRAVPHEHHRRDTGRYAQRLQPLHDRENAPIPPGTKVPRGPGKPSARSLLMIGDGRWLSRPDKLPEVQHCFYCRNRIPVPSISN